MEHRQKLIIDMKVPSTMKTEAEAEEAKPTTTLVNMMFQKLNVSVKVDGEYKHVEIPARGRVTFPGSSRELGPDVAAKLATKCLRIG